MPERTPRQTGKVAVILAMYNGVQYIEEQLDSLLSQTRTIDRVIIGDDGSNDGSMEVVIKYISKHNLQNTWKLFVNGNNKGHAGNFINLCKLINEDYVFFSDQDDIWMPDKIQSMLKIMEENQYIQMLCAEFINFSSKENLDFQIKNDQYTYTIECVQFSPQNYFFHSLGCSSCVRGNFIREILPYWTKAWEHDMFFWACAILQNNAYRYNAPVIYRRLHESNASRMEKKYLSKRIEQCQSSIQRPKNMIELLHRENIVEKSKLRFLKRYKLTLKIRIRMLCHRNPLWGFWLLFFCSDCYLHKEKGVLLDIYLCLFKTFPRKQ